MPSIFQRKVAIVTGGASGIGQALCEALSRHGASVIVADIDDDRARQTASAIAAHGGLARAAHLDVTNREHVQRLVADTAGEFGHLDYMFNNAALTASRGELCDLPCEAWLRAIDVNFLGVLYGTMAAYACMIRQGSGHIVNTASLAGLVGFPTSMPYGATKAAVVNLSMSLRMEAAARGVKVSVTCPGPVHSDTDEARRLIGVNKAARQILGGVERNRAIIVFPWLARLLWWRYRLSPDLVLPLGRRVVREYRAEQLAERESS